MGERDKIGGLQVPKGFELGVGCMPPAKLKGQGATSTAPKRAGRRLARVPASIDRAEFPVSETRVSFDFTVIKCPARVLRTPVESHLLTSAVIKSRDGLPQRSPGL